MSDLLNNPEIVFQKQPAPALKNNIKINLLGLSLQGMSDFFVSLGEKPFHAKQVIKWIHQRHVINFADMSDLSKSLRDKLTQVAEIIPPTIILSKPSEDGTHKFLIQTADKNSVETVFIPEDDRGTLCVSSQVGCMLTCTFCSTGTQGFNRNLAAHEIIGQLWIAAQQFRVTNIVMMGMGEPLLNFDNVVSAMSLMLDDFAYGLSRRKVTLSTSGVVPEIDHLAEVLPVSLAVSLHAPNDLLRNQIVPINKKYNIQSLLNACQRYLKVSPHKEITFEYVMLDHINETEQHAEELINLLKTNNLPSKINLIPFNPYPGAIYQRSSNNRIHRFQRQLSNAGFVCTIRKTRGDDIDAACGQLVGQVQDKTTRQAKHLEKVQGKLKIKN